MSKRATAAVAGIDLGGTNFAVAVVDSKGKIIGRCKRKTKAQEGRARVIARICDAVERACDEAKVTVASLQGVGIGAPSAIDVEAGMVLNAGNLGWKNVPLRDLLAAKLKLPVCVDNDVNMAAWGESTLGVGESRDLLAVWVGTGVGGGIILNGELWRGPMHTAGEIGQTILFPSASPGHQTLEENCSRSGMLRSMQAISGFYPRSHLRRILLERQADDGPVGSGALAQAYRDGDELAVRVIDSAADLLGLAIANWITVLSLRLVVLGGGVTEALGKPYIDRVRRSFERHVFPSALRKCEVVECALREDAGVLGAAMLARNSIASAGGSRNKRPVRLKRIAAARGRRG